MDYVTPPGQESGSAYIDCDPATGVDGSIVLAAAIEHPQREIVNAIAAAGITPDESDLTQLLQAIRRTAEPHLIIYDEPGDHTWIAPHSGYYKVTVIGGGGGGGGAFSHISEVIAAAAGGNAGGAAIKIIYLDKGASVPVTVGRGGVGGTGGQPGAGGTGETSSFGVHCSATGGSGAGNATIIDNTDTMSIMGFSPITVGRGVGGDINVNGGFAGPASQGIIDDTSIRYSTIPGPGGASLLSGGGGARNAVGAESFPALYGAGGGGARSPYGGAVNGWDGAPGVVLVEW